MSGKLHKIRLGSSKGFTLIELLMVVAIIAILASIAILQLSAYHEKGTRASMVADAHNVAINMEAFFSDCQTYPQPTIAAGAMRTLIPEAGQGTCSAANLTVVTFAVNSRNSLNVVAAGNQYTVIIGNIGSGAGWGNTQLVGGAGAVNPGCTWTGNGSNC